MPEHDSFEEQEFDYKADISIDPQALDVEWLRQPELMFEYGEALAEARRVCDHRKERVEVIKAEVSLEVRTGHPSGEKRITDAAVASIVICDTRVKKAMRRYEESKYEVEVLVAAVRALDGKKSALENLVRLHAQQYFAGPTEPRDLPLEARMSFKATRRSVRDKVTRSLNRGEEK